MLLRIIPITVVLVLAVSTAQAGIIISQDEIAIDEVAASACDFDSSDTQDEAPPLVFEAHSQGMSAASISSVKTSNSQALEDSYQLVLSRHEPRRCVTYENAELPLNPILDGLLKPS